MNRYICIHSHFYQPPRENPWLEAIEIQDEAYPFHNWNERINTECYACNAESRILDSEKRIIDLINNYTKISFNFGPTLLSWLEVHAPKVYTSILDADKMSQKIFSGHGSAIAQVYNHIIMPLASRKDKITQVRWGIIDFEQRFKRKPEGMWLSETAVDTETLEILADHGIMFTILSQYQADNVREIGTENWTDVKNGKIDSRFPYKCILPSGKSIALFFYNSKIAHDISFGSLINDGSRFAHRLLDAFDRDLIKPQLINVATDGETYGHHHRFGDMALAFCYYYIESKNHAKITIYGEFLDKYPPMYEVRIKENSSWSCVHGVERWRNNCGCFSGGKPHYNQNWRKPLRDSLDWLSNKLIPIFENELSGLLKKPWEARNDYINVILNRSKASIINYINKHLKPEKLKILDEEQQIKIIELMEMQRYALLMYTSCAWFFNDISGIETIQIISYAARAIQLAKKISGADLETQFVNILAKAISNKSGFGNGEQIYNNYIKILQIDLKRIAAHFGIVSLFNKRFNKRFNKQFYKEENTHKIYCYSAKEIDTNIFHAGIHTLSIGKVLISSNITLEKKIFFYVILHLVDHNIHAGVSENINNKKYINIRKEIETAFNNIDISETILKIDKHFNENTYTINHVFKGEQRKIFQKILTNGVKDITDSIYQLYEKYYSIMQTMLKLKVPLPTSFYLTGEYIANIKLCKIFQDDNIDNKEILKVFKEIKQFSFEIDKPTLEYLAQKRITSLMERCMDSPYNMHLYESLETILGIIKDLSLEVDIWEAQNIYFNLCEKIYLEIKSKALKDHDSNKDLFQIMKKISKYLKVHYLTMEKR